MILWLVIYFKAIITKNKCVYEKVKKVKKSREYQSCELLFVFIKSIVKNFQFNYLKFSNAH